MQVNNAHKIQSQINVGNLRITGSLSDEQFAQLTNILNDVVKSQKDQENLIKLYLSENDFKNKSFLDVKNDISVIKCRLDDILKNSSASDSIKSLLAEGRILEAEEILDNEYRKEDQYTEIALAKKSFQLGEVKELRLKYQEAFDSYRKAAVLCPNNTHYLRTAGKMANNLAMYKDAIDLIQQALSIDKKCFGEVHDSFFLNNNYLGIFHRNIGELSQSIFYLKRSLKCCLKIHVPNNPEVSKILNNIGESYRLLGKYKIALKYFKRAISIDLETLDELDPEVAKRYTNIGLTYNSLESYKLSIVFLEKALASSIKNYGEYHPDVAIDYNNLGVVSHSMNLFDKAILYYKKAINIDHKIFGQDHPKLANRYNNIGEALLAKQLFNDAYRYFQLSIKIDFKVYGEQHPNIATRLINIGKILISTDTEKAIKYFTKAHGIDCKNFDNNHPSIARDFEALGDAYNHLSQKEKSEFYYRKSLNILIGYLGPESEKAINLTKKLDRLIR